MDGNGYTVALGIVILFIVLIDWILDQKKV